MDRNGSSHDATRHGFTALPTGTRLDTRYRVAGSQSRRGATEVFRLASLSVKLVGARSVLRARLCAWSP